MYLHASLFNNYEIEGYRKDLKTNNRIYQCVNSELANFIHLHFSTVINKKNEKNKIMFKISNFIISWTEDFKPLFYRKSSKWVKIYLNKSLSVDVWMWFSEGMTEMSKVIMIIFSN